MTDPTQLEVTLVSQGAGHTAVRVDVPVPTWLKRLPIPDAPSRRGAEPTSAEAGHAVRHRAQTLRVRVLTYLQGVEWGCTADEIAVALGESVLAIRPRCSELKAAGLIHATGARRRNASGMSAAVWVVT